MPRDIPTCPTGKTFHPTMESATRQLVSLKKDGEADNMHAYRCGKCGCWHVGHKPKTQRGLAKKKRAKGD